MDWWIGGLVDWWTGGLGTGGLVDWGLVDWWAGGLVGWWTGGLVDWWIGDWWIGGLVDWGFERKGSTNCFVVANFSTKIFVDASNISWNEIKIDYKTLIKS